MPHSSRILPINVSFETPSTSFTFETYNNLSKIMIMDALAKKVWETLFSISEKKMEKDM